MMNFLIVDDRTENLYLLESLLKGSGYKVVTADNGAEALEKLHGENFDMIISDILMPVMDGFQLCRKVKTDKNLKEIPLIFYTATYTDEKDEEAALKIGADRFIRKPAEPDELIKAIRDVISDAEKSKKITGTPSAEENEDILKLYSERLVKKLEKKTLDLKREINERKKAEEALKQSYDKLQLAIGGTINALAAMSEWRDPYTAGHQKRVAELSCAIAEEMNFSEKQIRGIHMSALIHDVGKINVPSEILSKPGKLTKFEFEMIKTHPQVCYDILKDIEFPWPIAQAILQHHERTDGSGYPHGLSGEKICSEARILAVADVVEAMASHRPYRPALNIDKALEEISQNKGFLYEPNTVDACLKVFTEEGFNFE